MGWFFGKKKSTKFKSRVPMTRKEKLLKLAQTDTFYSVSITRCGCKTSAKLAGKSFLFEQAPALPLPNCTVITCTCEYQGVVNHRHHGDRRIKTRRAAIRMDSDRRKLQRRKIDSTWNKSSS